MALNTNQEIILLCIFFLCGIFIVLAYQNYRNARPEVLTPKMCKNNNLPRNDKRFTHIFVSSNSKKRIEKANLLISEIKPRSETCSNEISEQHKMLDTYMYKLNEFQAEARSKTTEAEQEVFVMAKLPEIQGKFTTILKRIQAQLSSRTDLDHQLNFLSLVQGGHEKSYVFRHLEAQAIGEMKSPQMAMALQKFTDALEIAPSEYKNVATKWINEMNN